jgi:anti-anti-sigma factor
VNGITVCEQGQRGVLVQLSGEFDLHDLGNLRDALGGATGRPVAVVDLSGVTFMDIGATRELAVRAQLHAGRLKLRNPSRAVRASVAACGFESWFDFCAGGDS